MRMSKSPAAPQSAFPDLTAIRKRRGLSLEDIAQATKISPGYLRAIEEGRFEHLPGGIYDLNYLRQYARAIDYDEDELIRRYRETLERCSSTSPVERHQDPKPRARLRWPLISLRNLL